MWHDAEAAKFNCGCRDGLHKRPATFEQKSSGL
jgi:hypothetical protein